MRTLIVLALLATNGQDEKAVAAAAKATLETGSFTLQVTPVADLKDALPQDRATVAGVPLVANQLKDGIFRATDGATELYGRDKFIVINTKEGWRAASDVIGEMVAEIQEAYGKDENARKNVGQAKVTYRKLLAIAQLASRALPPTQYLTRLESDFKNLKKGATDVIDGKRFQLYEGEMKDAAAQVLLTGPYDSLVKDGTLVISDFSGIGRVWISPEGLVRRTEFRAAGKYTSVNKDEKTKKTTAVTIKVVADILKPGETKMEVPQEAVDKIKAAEAAKEDK